MTAGELGRVFQNTISGGFNPSKAIKGGLTALK
jgi:hypothetical protein